MKILHLCYNHLPRMNAVNGGQLRYWQNLKAMTTLGHEVHLVLLFGGTSDELEPDVKALAAEIFCLRRTRRWRKRSDVIRGVLSVDSALAYYTRTTPEDRTALENVVDSIKPDLIWTEAYGGMYIAPSHVPTVYSHHDFYYKILDIRAKAKDKDLAWKDHLLRRQLKRGELMLCRKANAVVCVSASEFERIKAINPNSSYIPIVGPTLHLPQNDNVSAGRIFLFGNSGNSALFYAREHLRNDLWPLLKPALAEVEWHQVGLIMAHHEDRPDIQWLRQNFNEVHGFVEDLGTVFRTGDISLVPYTEDTGFRTKFVTAASYGVINAGYRTTFECAPEFEHGKNSLIADSPAELVRLLQEVTQNEDWRAVLAAGARQLYEEQFSFESQLPLYKRVLESI